MNATNMAEYLIYADNVWLFKFNKEKKIVKLQDLLPNFIFIRIHHSIQPFVFENFTWKYFWNFLFPGIQYETMLINLEYMHSIVNVWTREN